MLPSGKGVIVGLVVIVGVSSARVVADIVRLGIRDGGSIVGAILIVGEGLFSSPHPTKARRIKNKTSICFIFCLVWVIILSNPFPSF
jgi:hypothetical protein